MTINELIISVINKEKLNSKQVNKLIGELMLLQDELLIKELTEETNE